MVLVFNYNCGIRRRIEQLAEVLHYPPFHIFCRFALLHQDEEASEESKLLHDLLIVLHIPVLVSISTAFKVC